MTGPIARRRLAVILGCIAGFAVCMLGASMAGPFERLTFVGAPSQVRNVVWDTTFGELRLNQFDGDYSFSGSGGLVSGHVRITKANDSLLGGIWTQSSSGQRCADGTYRGMFQFQFSSDWSRFQGSFGYCDGPISAGAWNGTRKGDGSTIDPVIIKNMPVTRLGPTIAALHTPMQPSSAQAVTYTAAAHATNGVAKIEIWVAKSPAPQRVCCVAGQEVALQLPADLTNAELIKTCEPRRTTDATCTANGGPYNGNVVYRAVVVDGAGIRATDEWISYYAGQLENPSHPELNDAIPIYVRDADHGINVVFAPDSDDYAGDRSRFIRDVEDFIKNGYFAESAFSNDRRRWNFYVTYNSVATKPIGPGAKSDDLCIQNKPSDWSVLAATADAVGIVHTNPCRDNAGLAGGGATTEFTIQTGLGSVAAHETGHAVFGLADEYCCDGGNHDDDAWPHRNLFANLSDCDTNAVAHGVAMSSCTQLTETNRFCGGKDGDGNPKHGGSFDHWTYDVPDLMSCPLSTWGPADQARIAWFYGQL